MHPRPALLRPGQESVRSFPRPARAEPGAAHVVIEHRGRVIAYTRHPVRMTETSHQPSWCIPPVDVASSLLRPARGRSLCGRKDKAVHRDVALDQEEVPPRLAWSHPDPTPPFAVPRDHPVFRAAPTDRCLVDGKVATPQPGRFHGGWISSRAAGAFRGLPRREGW